MFRLHARLVTMGTWLVGQCLCTASTLPVEIIEAVVGIVCVPHVTTCIVHAYDGVSVDLSSRQHVANHLSNVTVRYLSNSFS